ncbi:flavin reductase family protein [Mucilaginibacter antarcticus]|uniref:flavin reductase family protein n=1 Tax=Mucilaginibacter antarcticus TaxID=1855725 RepID=UPI0036324256
MEQINSFEEEFKSKFTCYHFHTKSFISDRYPNLIEGRISSNKVQEIIRKTSTDDSVHYICGPAGLKESVSSTLIKHGISDGAIFSEDFELVKDPKDFVDIITQDVSIIFEGTEYTIEIAKGKSILEAALDANIELPYSCQVGNCSSCIGQLLHGDLKTIGVEHRSELLSDEYLLCCSYPMTKNIKIKI